MDQNNQNIVLINIKLKNRQAYLKFDDIFEFLGQFTITCIFQKGADNFD